MKQLFAVDVDEVKKDVIANVGSLDGAALVERIDEAMGSGEWTDAQDLWAYIKSRRIRLKDRRDGAEQKILDDFIASQEAQNLFILSRGALEDYLPAGYRSKDMSKLIGLVAADDFWDQLPEEPRADLERIAKILLAIPDVEAEQAEAEEAPTTPKPAYAPMS